MRVLRIGRSAIGLRSSDAIPCGTLMKSSLSVKTLISSTFAKTKVFLRLVLSRSTPSTNSWQSVSSDLKTRIVLQSTDSSLKQSSNFNELIKRLLNAQKVLFSRPFIGRNVDIKRIVGTSGLSLGLVGICVKKNGPTLITETDVLESNCQEIRNVFSGYRRTSFRSKFLDSKELSLKNIEFGPFIAKGCNAVVYSAKLKEEPNICNNRLAIKMMFNFEAESNAVDVWKALNKECVPFSGHFATEELSTKRNKLESHPNIVEIMSVFVDRTPHLEGALQLYPDALPTRMGGFGRNMTLFIVEKRYDQTLKEYLMTREVPSSTSMVMLTQLLEAIAFLVKCQITHRDLKTDNILLTLNGQSDVPWLVVSDFGSCLTTLKLSFQSDEVCRGGNRALMAPEIICAESGPFATLDYSRSDLWSVGAIAYELFNGLNPFYAYPQRQQCLHNYSYRESQLPDPPESMPPLIRRLVRSLLNRNPFKRTDVMTAVTVCQMALHMSPHLIFKLLTTDSQIKRDKQLFDWLKTLSFSTLSKGGTFSDSEVLTDIELKLRVLFLSHVRIRDLNRGLEFMAHSFD